MNRAKSAGFTQIGLWGLIIFFQQSSFFHELSNSCFEAGGAPTLPGGNYLVAFTGEHTVKEGDPAGNVLRTIPVPGDAVMALRLGNGNALVACGDGHKVIEMDPAGETAWELNENDIPGVPLRFGRHCPDLQRICNWGGHGHVGRRPQVVEVTHDKKVMWQVYDHKRLKTPSNIHLLDQSAATGTAQAVP